jgi:hypothetical protein
MRANDLSDSEDRRKFAALGWGRSFPFWGQVIRLQLLRLEELEKQLPAVNENLKTNFDAYGLNNPVMHDWWVRTQADGHFLLVSIVHVLRLGRHFEKLTEGLDERPKSTLQCFHSKYRDAEALRGILEHFDEYSFKSKTDKRTGVGPETLGLNLENQDDRITLVIGKRSLPLVPLGQAAFELAYQLNVLWNEMLTVQPTATEPS